MRKSVLGVLSLQWNAEGNLKTPVLRRKRGSACVFGRTNRIKGLGRAPFSIEVFSLDSIHFAVATAQVIKQENTRLTIRENRGVYFESQTIKYYSL